MNVLVVDDQSSARMMIRKVLEEIDSPLCIADFQNPVEALAWSRTCPADLVLLDYRMPEMDGLQFLREFRRVPANRDVAVVLITVVGDAPVRQAALEAGVTEFLVKPIHPRELLARCRNFLSMRQLAASTKARASALERCMAEGMQTIQQRQRETLLAIAQATDLRFGAGMHVTRIARFAALIAEQMQLPDTQVRNIELAAPLHDIGLIAMPDSLVSARTPLCAEESLALAEHTRIGWNLLAQLSDPLLQFAAGIALSHHERWDGTGYPNRHSGTQIPLEARIVGLADSFDNLIANKDGISHSLDTALEYVRQQAGAAFDPDCVDALFANPAILMELSRSSAAPTAFAPAATAAKLRA